MLCQYWTTSLKKMKTELLYILKCNFTKKIKTKNIIQYLLLVFSVSVALDPIATKCNLLVINNCKNHVRVLINSNWFEFLYSIERFFPLIFYLFQIFFLAGPIYSIQALSRDLHTQAPLIKLLLQVNRGVR